MNSKHRVLTSTPGKTFFVGDLHGHYDDFILELVRRGFRHKTDRVICCGDLIDKGSQSLKCLKLLKLPWFFSAMGNHEEMLLDEFRTGYTQQPWFNELSGGGKDEAIALIQRHMPLSYTVKICDQKKIGVVHAHPPVNGWAVDWNDIENQGIENFLWKRVRRNHVPAQIVGAEVVVFGHNNVERPTRFGAGVCIDTLAASGLTIIEAYEVMGTIIPGN